MDRFIGFALLIAAGWGLCGLFISLFPKQNNCSSNDPVVTVLVTVISLAAIFGAWVLLKEDD